MKERGRDSKFFSEMANKRWKKHFASPISTHDAPQVSSGGDWRNNAQKNKTF